jgi:hypothetical protein
MPDPVPAAASAAGATAAEVTVSPVRGSAPVRARSVDGRRPSLLVSRPAILGLVAVLALAVVMVAMARPAPEQAALVFTDPPSSGSASALTAAASPVGPLVVVPVPSPGESGPGIQPTAPMVTGEPVDPTAPGATARVTPGSTPTPGATRVATPPPTPKPTPKPTPVPTPVPTPIPTPTPVPTPSPRVNCDVIDLVNTNTGAAQGAWTAAGFTGTVTIVPGSKPQYKIGWQSITAGGTVKCTSGITVQELAP